MRYNSPTLRYHLYQITLHLLHPFHIIIRNPIIHDRIQFLAHVSLLGFNILNDLIVPFHFAPTAPLCPSFSEPERLPYDYLRSTDAGNAAVYSIFRIKKKPSVFNLETKYLS